MERYSGSLTFRDVQIKTTMRCHLHLLAVSKRQIIIGVGKDVGKLEPLYILGGNVELVDHIGKQLDSSSNACPRVTI